MAIPARAHGRQVNLVQALSLLLAFVLVAGIGGVLSAGLVMPAVASVSVLANGSTTVFSDLPSSLAEQPLSQKSTMYANDGTTVLATFYTENRINVPLTAIAPIMQEAVVSIEDKRFFQHGAIDPQGMARAATKNALASDSEGASTLTQQYVKNVLVEAAAAIDDPVASKAAMIAANTAKGTAGLSRKLHEAKLAIALEKKYTKNEILGRYLNIAPFGSSEYGVEAASEYFFSKKAADLNYLEAATLAGVPKNPQKLDPIAYPKAATARRNAVLLTMKDQKFITAAQYAAGKATPVADVAHGGYLNVQKVGQTCQAANAVANSGFFCDYVTKVIAQNPVFGATPQARTDTLYRGGLTITTTLDPAMQQIADDKVKAAIPVDDPSGVGDAISVVEPGSGKILAMAQNRTYNPYQTAAARETSMNYNTDFAYGGSGGFGPGSTFKAFTLVEWLKEGHTLNETIDATRKLFAQKEFKGPSCGSTRFYGQWPVGNARSSPARSRSASTRRRRGRPTTRPGHAT
jgi:membrane peptidoglycan carboxypeptidase